MADNLFPESVEEEIESTNSEETDDTVQFGRSWKFDHEKGEFAVGPTGKVAEADPYEAWVEWCKNAINTTRYRYLAYTDDHGQEFDDLIARYLTREANESEVQRLTTECLMVDLRTDRVDNFSFEWDKDKLFFACDIYNVRGEMARIESEVSK